MRAHVQLIASEPDFARRLVAKRLAREKDEAIKPLEKYRAEELEKMRRNFFGFDPSYHVARRNFIRKVAKSRTPLHLALHRSLRPRRDIA
jgi:putative two-component system hydrogenase maturation factor HypX/HoxX